MFSGSMKFSSGSLNVLKRFHPLHSLTDHKNLVKEIDKQKKMTGVLLQISGVPWA